ncbi:MAG: hypothetical protein KC912_07745 [Proteobacteria bacterium]|nr:hypothetical protein [Pseudomonadota bacterium]
MLWMLISATFAAPSCDALEAWLSEPSAERCSTSTLLRARSACPDVLARHGLPVVAPHRGTPTPPPGSTKVTRDVLDTWTNVLETDNFAVKWGDDTTVNTADIQRIADSFEAVWAEEVVNWGYPPPEHSTTYRFNIYIGDTGAPSPSAAGYGGYFWYDSEGYPEIVLERLALTDVDWADDLAAHEFFHALQGVIDTYDYAGAGGWYWEATASWAETEIRGTKPSNSTNTPSVFLLPELNVGTFGDIDNDTWADYHQYGAAVFVRHMTTLTEDRDIVRRSWVEAPPYGDPLLVLDDLLGEHGTSIGAMHDDYTSRLPTWDFPEGDVYELVYDDWSGGADDHRLQGTLAWGGDRVTAAPDHPPQSFGANLWTLDTGADVSILVTPQSTPDAWFAAISARDNGQAVQIPIPVGEVYNTEGIAALTDVHLVVSPRAATDDYTSTYTYSLVVDRPVVEEEEPRACGCTSSPFSAFGFVLPLIAMRRRR